MPRLSMFEINVSLMKWWATKHNDTRWHGEPTLDSHLKQDWIHHFHASIFCQVTCFHWTIFAWKVMKHIKDGGISCYIRPQKSSQMRIHHDFNPPCLLVYKVKVAGVSNRIRKKRYHILWSLLKFVVDWKWHDLKTEEISRWLAVWSIVNSNLFSNHLTALCWKQLPPL